MRHGRIQALREARPRSQVPFERFGSGNIPPPPKPAIIVKSSPKRSLPSQASSPTPAPSPQLRRRILLVDDHPFMRAGLAQLIERQVDMMVCGEAGNPTEALQAI